MMKPKFFELLATLALTTATASADVCGKYMVIDISGGASADCYPVTYVDEAPERGWGDAFKTVKIVLRRVEAGRFRMSDDAEESAWRQKYDQADTRWKMRLLRFECHVREVEITKPYYIGVFEVTQRQYELVVGKITVADECAGAMRPAPVSWEEVRAGSIKKKIPSSLLPNNPRVALEVVTEVVDPKYDWPRSVLVKPESFFGLLRKRTGMTGFDLPTEAQWEFACKGGRGKMLEKNADDVEFPLGIIGCYSANYTEEVGGYTNGFKVVGSYLPNGLGLYDMHGNAYEWCLDWCGKYLDDDCIDPVGPKYSDTEMRVLRGGSWMSSIAECRSSARYGSTAYLNSPMNTFGFRIVARLDSE